jgi:hypothetical protein
LRQGDSNSPLLFNVVLENAIRRSKVETRGTVYDKYSPVMAYAYVTGIRLQEVREVFSTLAEQPNKIGLEINEKKKYYGSMVKVKIAKLIKMNQDHSVKKNYDAKEHIMHFCVY